MVSLGNAEAKAQIDPVLSLLSRPFVNPADNNAVTSEAWMDLEGLDSVIAGTLMDFREEGNAIRLSRSAVAEWRRSIEDHRIWADLWPDRADAPLDACDILE